MNDPIDDFDPRVRKLSEYDESLHKYNKSLRDNEIIRQLDKSNTLKEEILATQQAQLEEIQWAQKLTELENKSLHHWRVLLAASMLDLNNCLLNISDTSSALNLLKKYQVFFQISPPVGLLADELSSFFRAQDTFNKVLQYLNTAVFEGTNFLEEITKAENEAKVFLNIEFYEFLKKKDRNSESYISSRNLIFNNQIIPSPERIKDNQLYLLNENSSPEFKRQATLFLGKNQEFLNDLNLVLVMFERLLADVDRAELAVLLSSGWIDKKIYDWSRQARYFYNYIYSSDLLNNKKYKNNSGCFGIIILVVFLITATVFELAS